MLLPSCQCCNVDVPCSDLASFQLSATQMSEHTLQQHTVQTVAYCRHPQNAMLSPGAASSLVNAALEWCQSTVPDQLRTSLKSAHDSKCARSELLSALAAVLSFLNAHIKARQV